MVLIVHAGYNGACTGIYCVRATPKRPYLEALLFMLWTLGDNWRQNPAGQLFLATDMGTDKGLPPC